MDRMDFATMSIHRNGRSPLYLQLADAVAGAISRGELADGARLPSERDLAGLLTVSRTTAVNAYRELEARGLVRGFVGRGTYVCAGVGPAGEVAGGAPFAWRGKVALGAQRALDPGLLHLVQVATAPGVISFAAGACALDRFPLDAFRAATERILRRNATAALGLGPIEGQLGLRRAIAARWHGGADRADRVLVLSGAQQGLDLISRCLLDPGDVVVMDRPGYLGAIHVFRAADALLVGWDATRADLAELDDLLLRYRPKLLYTSPTFGNPTGRTLDERTRRGLLDLAARHRVPVIEDDPYRDLAFPGSPPVPPTLAALDGGDLVIFLGTFAKTLAGGLRLGWLAASPAIVDHLARIKGASDVATSGLTQLVVAELLASGRLDAHLGALREEHARRHGAMIEALRRHLPAGSLAVRPAAGGLYLWGRLAGSVGGEDAQRAALVRGVGIAAGEPFYPDGAGGDELRLCFSAEPPDRIDEGVRELAAAIRQVRAHPRARTETLRAAR
jgi:DNA-binding transcriptional MocR family regulator